MKKVNLVCSSLSFFILFSLAHAVGGRVSGQQAQKHTHTLPSHETQPNGFSILTLQSQWVFKRVFIEMEE